MSFQNEVKRETFTVLVFGPQLTRISWNRSGTISHLLNPYFKYCFVSDKDSPGVKNVLYDHI